MAAIDSLLALVEAQKATGIVFRSREPPALIGGKGRGLTMPPLDGEMIQTIAAELLAPGELEQLRVSGACDTVYRSEQGTFVVEARATGDKMSLKLRTGGAAPVRAPTPTVPAVPAVPAIVAPVPGTAPPPPPPAATPITPARARTHDDGASRLGALIARAADPSVSDIVVSAGQALWIRGAGTLLARAGEVVTGAEIESFVSTLLDAPRREILDRTGSVDLAWDVSGRDPDESQRFRVNVFTQSRGLALALRPVRRRVPSLHELNLPDSVGALAGLDGGLVLVVGPTGSGKSTTLAAMVEAVNQSSARHVVTLEDPIEFVYRPRRSLIHQREVGTHLPSFSDGLRAALRESPDVILLGEMRDRETAALALTAAETGHLVLSTLHSGSASMAIDRILDVFPEREQAQIRLQVAGSLRAIVTQRLLAGIAPGTRYPALEILMASHAVAALIREGKTHQLATQIQTGRDDGMVAFDSSLLELVRAGHVDRETALGAARAPAELQRRLRDAGL